MECDNMDAVKIAICIIDNGSVSQMERTQKSLAVQSCQDFETHIIEASVFWKPDRSKLHFGCDYVVFVYSGSTLEANTVEVCRQAIQECSASWFYFDERNFDAEINGNSLGISNKPDFDTLALISKFDFQEGLLFSNQILEEMMLDYCGPHFGVALAEMFFSASMKVPGVHIPQSLLVRHNRQPLLPQELSLLNNTIQTYLNSQILPLKSTPRTDRPGLHLFPDSQEQIGISVILISNESSGTVPSVPSWADDSFEIIHQTGNTPYRDKCRAGAAVAKFDILCFIDACCEAPSQEVFRRLANFTALPFSGLVSPCLFKDNKFVYAGVTGPTGQVLPLPRNRSILSLLPDIMSVRETSIPAWQFWMIKKELYHKIDTAISEKNCAPRFLVQEYASQAKYLLQKNLYIGDTPISLNSYNSASDAADFFSALYRWRGADPFCPASIRGWSYNHAFMRAESYFPKQLAPYSPEKKKLFIITHELSLTGAPIVLSHAAHILKDAGWQIIVVSPSDGVLKKDFLYMGIPVLILKDMDTNEEWLHMAADCDLVLVNTIVLYRQIEQLRDHSIPVMWWLHDARSGYETHLQHILPETIGSNIHTYAVSRYAEKAVNDYRPQYPTNLLLYGLNDEAVQLDSQEYLPEDSGNKKVFISIGSIIPRKGQDILVKAIRSLPEEIRKQCLFLFIGQAANKDIYKQIQELISDYPTSVQYIKSVPHEKVFSLFHQANGVICSSRDDPLPTFMAETMMVSGICICSENTGTAPAITHGKNGFVYHNDDPNELADCIKYVCGLENTDCIRAEARTLFEQVFSMDVFTDNLLRCIAHCIETEQGETNHEG